MILAGRSTSVPLSCRKSRYYSRDMKELPDFSDSEEFISELTLRLTHALLQQIHHEVTLAKEEILQKIQEVEASIEVLARHLAEQDEPPAS